MIRKKKGSQGKKNVVRGSVERLTRKIERTNKNLSEVIDRGSFAEGNMHSESKITEEEMVMQH
jgi:hypothetical protein